jgi:hypothetical protein
LFGTTFGADKSEDGERGERNSEEEEQKASEEWKEFGAGVVGGSAGWGEDEWDEDQVPEVRSLEPLSVGLVG